MPNSSDILEVTTVAGKRVHSHPCSGFHVDERGNLVIAHDDKTVGAYAAGHWIRAVRTNNDKATAKGPPPAPGKAPSEMATAAQATRAQGRARPRRGI